MYNQSVCLLNQCTALRTPLVIVNYRYIMLLSVRAYTLETNKMAESLPIRGTFTDTCLIIFSGHRIFLGRVSPIKLAPYGLKITLDLLQHATA